MSRRALIGTSAILTSEVAIVKVSERLAPTVAVASALSTLLCCLPLGFAAALGAAGLSAVAMQYRAWLVGASALLLVAGFMQVYRRPRTACARRSSVSILLLWASAFLVFVVFLMPQLVASLLADWLP